MKARAVATSEMIKRYGARRDGQSEHDHEAHEITSGSNRDNQLH